MDQNSAEQRQHIYFPRPHRSLFERQANHCCPFCSKAYRTSTWLENHIKTKHTTAITQEKSEIPADKNNSYRSSVKNAMLLPSPFQESRRPGLTQDVPATVALLKQLLPLMEELLPILEQLDGVSLYDSSMGPSNLRVPKRSASSPDLRGEQGAKLRELDSTVTGMYTSGNQIESQNHPGGATSHGRTSVNNGNPHGTQYTGSMTAFSEGSQFRIDSPRYSRRILRNPYSEQAQGPEEVLSYISTPYLHPQNQRVPQQRHQWRPSQTPESYSQLDNTTSVPYESLAGNPLPSFSSGLFRRQREDASDGLSSAEPLLGTTQPEANFQRSYSVEDPHQEAGQHQPTLKEWQQYPFSTSQQTTEHIIGDYHTDIFQGWNLSATMDPASITPTARLVEETTTERGYHDRSGKSVAGKAPTNSKPGNC